LRHPYHDEWRDREDELDASTAAKAEYRHGVASGELPRPNWASQAVDLITELRPAADLVADIAAQAQDALTRALGR
jgi:nitronate monooxygenase